ncbi:MAG: hypothetical protein ACQEP8_00050 [Chlamydiota bacterium]
MSAAPIAVFCFNRPHHLQLTLEALGRCPDYSDHLLFIYCDAPRNEGDQIACAATQAVAHKWSELYGGKVIIRSRNMRFENLVEGISEMCDKFGKVIVIEDDIIVAPDFLDFMEKSLTKYEHDERIYMVGGHMYDGMQSYPNSTYFLPHAYIWGWATWQRAWKNFTFNPQGVDDLYHDRQLRHRFDYYRHRKHTECLETALNADPPHSYAWDILWSYIIFKNQGLGLYPSHNLVWNSGIKCGAHGVEKLPSLEGYQRFVHGKASLADYHKPRLPHNWSFPEKTEVDQEAFDRLVNLFKKDNFRKKWSRKIYKNYKRLLRGCKFLLGGFYGRSSR